MQPQNESAGSQSTITNINICQSQSSIDSSNILDGETELSQTQSLALSIDKQLDDELCKTIKQARLKQNITNSDSIEYHQLYQFSPEERIRKHQQQCPLSIQKPRIGQRFAQSDNFNCLLMENQNPYTKNSPVGFFGFVKGANKKPIHINESKIKKAERMFDESPLYFCGKQKPKIDSSSLSPEISSDDQNSNDKSFEKKIKTKKQLSIGRNNLASFSMGFKNAGTGSSVIISQENSIKAKAFFQQFESEQCISQKKPTTKLKLPQKYEENWKKNNLLKTVTFEQKRNSFYPKVKTINAQKCKAVSKQQIIVSQLNMKPLRYQSFKLSDLPTVTQQMYVQFAQSWKHYEYDEIFVHKHTECKINCCYFCKKQTISESISPEQSLHINKQLIIKQLSKIILTSKYQKQEEQMVISILQYLYRIVIFKLLRYKVFYSQLNISNKNYNANNILIQVYRKYSKIAKSMPDTSLLSCYQYGPLAASIAQLRLQGSKVLGRSLNVAVMDIQYSSEMKCVYIQLTDGWSIAYAIISSKNSLFTVLTQYKNRLLVGQKLCICDWNLYFVQNILDFHPAQHSLKNKQIIPIIQFNFNNSRRIQHHQKLGYSQKIVYRSIYSHKINGGNIPLIQGIVLRMFTRKNGHNKPDQYFLELLICKNSTIFLKFPLSQEMALSDYFTLYTCYQFRKTKLLANHGQRYIEFCDKSAFYEIKDENKNQKISIQLKNRLFNINYDTFLKDQQQKKFVDLIFQNKQFEIGDDSFQIVDITRSVKPVLIQQYTLLQNANKYSLIKGDRGALLTRIPAIYKNIEYKVY